MFPLLLLSFCIGWAIHRRRRRITAMVPLLLGTIALSFLVADVCYLLEAFRATALADPSMKATVLAGRLSAQTWLTQLEVVGGLALVPVAWLVDRWLRARAQH
jgi:hypothetical protein